MKTIGDIIHSNIRKHNFSLSILDSKGNDIYYESSNRFWHRWKYDSNGKQTYYENSSGFWEKRKYDSNSKEIFCESSDGIIVYNK